MMSHVRLSRSPYLRFGFAFGIVVILILAGLSLLAIFALPQLRGNQQKIVQLSSEFSQTILGIQDSPNAKPIENVQFENATGPLRVNPANPRYFTDNTGKAILLAGDHTWYTLQDGGSVDPPPALDYDEYLDFLQSQNINFFRFFIFEQAKWSALVGSEWYYSPTIYQRTGPGIALDGKPKFDLTQFDQPYFDRLRERVIQADQRGIYVSIQLFEGFSVENKPAGSSPASPWPGHPFNMKNNINDIDGDPDRDGNGTETETLAIPEITSFQEAYVRKVIDTVNDLDNVLFEICNESSAGAAQTEWQNHMIDFIHNYEAGKPKQNPVGFTVQWPGGSNKDLFTSNAEWISPNSDGGYFDDPPATEGIKVILNDTDHLCYPCGNRAWAWKSFVRGYNPAFMDPYDCNGDPSPAGCNPNEPTWVSLRRNLGYILTYATRMNLVKMTPRPELCSTGYCLANPTPTGAEYLIYLPTGRTATALLDKLGKNKKLELYLPADSHVTVDLSATSEILKVEWFNPDYGTTTDGGTVTGGGIQSFTAPFGGDAVLYLYSTSRHVDTRRFYLTMLSR